MAVERVAAAITNHGTFISSLTLANVAVDASSNRCLVCNIGVRDPNAGSGATGVVFKEAGGDKSFTNGGVKVETVASGIGRRVSSMWYLVAPANETKNVVITFSGALSRVCGAAFELKNVDQSSPVGAGKTVVTVFGKTHAVTFTGMDSGDLAVATICEDSNRALTVDGASTETYNFSPDATTTFAGAEQQTQNPTITWTTLVSCICAISGIPFQEAAGPGPGPSPTPSAEGDVVGSGRRYFRRTRVRHSVSGP